MGNSRGCWGIVLITLRVMTVGGMRWLGTFYVGDWWGGAEEFRWRRGSPCELGIRRGLIYEISVGKIYRRKRSSYR
jgi:hypothetical protein